MRGIPRNVSPVPWYGGKARLVDWILPHVPPHGEYLELFGGGAALLFAKWVVGVETYNDIDSGLVNLFRVLRDKEQFAEFQRVISATPYSREEYYFCRAHWQEAEDPVERARRWFVVARQCFSGSFGKGWKYMVRAWNVNTRAWESAIAELPRFHQRFQYVQVENLDWKAALAKYAVAPSVLVYADPPYLRSLRSEIHYQHEIGDAAHGELVQALLSCPAMVILSGYQHGVYEPLEAAGWQRFDKDVACSSVLSEYGGEKQRRVESLWVNPLAIQARYRNTLLGV